MSSYVGLNRRKGSERRILDTSPVPGHRSQDRRRLGADTYMLVAGNGGIDRFSAVCLLVLALIAIITTVRF